MPEEGDDLRKPAPETAVRPADREAELFNEHLFCELRAYAQVPDDFINSGWDLDQLKAGGGKGGALMVRVGHAYLVKELSSGDHMSLLAIAGSYGRHVRGGETLLCPIYLHFRDVQTGRMFVAMRNSTGKGPFAALYDLKGCADDKTVELKGIPIRAVHKRIWNVGMWCSTSAWSEERVRYFEGKKAARNVNICMTSEQRSKFLHCVKRDTEWLASQQLMDYSLLVAIKEGPAGSSASGGSGPSALGHRPMLRKGPNGEIALHVSIIDFLQKWTAGKRVAGCIKFMETNKATIPPAAYAERFRRHFEQRALAVPQEEFAQQSASPPLVQPPAGDCEVEGRPEERLNSREAKSRESSRQMKAPDVNTVFEL
mmetsp:Transcript_48141/g.111494  ORF Transcript_48141/g.111494 Transcript_48141/m.111494 type:complete len:370 (+) Transcript_48141:114-1223(+)